MPRSSPRLRPALRPLRPLRGMIGLALVATVLAPFAGPMATPAAAQSGESPVYLDDSPRARDLLLRAIDQIEDNTGEAVRTLQTLLDEFGDRLVPDPRVRGEVLVGVRTAALTILRGNEELLARHRLLEAGEAERRVERGDLRSVAETRPLTPAGLEALLRLGQESLESARFDEAIRHLDEALGHPDLDDETGALAWTMIGTASHFAANRPWNTAEAQRWYAARVDAARTALDAYGESAAGALDAFGSRTGGGAGPRLDHGSGPMDRAGTKDLEATSGEVIWSVLPVDGAIVTVDDESSQALPGAQLAALSRRTATVAGDAVHIADHVGVTSVDRFTARPRWPGVSYTEASGGIGDDDAIGMRPVAVEANALVAILGTATSESASDKNTAYVVRLNSDTGRVAWRKRIARLGGREEYSGLYPHGRPWIADGRVLMLARRVTNERILSCYVIALDLETGDPQWIRHVASVGTRLPVDKPVTSLLYDRGALYLASPVGATARLDAASGRVEWLVRSVVPSILLGPRPRPYEVGAPVIVRNRLVSIRPDRRAIEIRSLDDGRLAGQAPLDLEAPLGEPDYLLTDGRQVFAVGEDVRCFDPNFPDAPLWVAPARDDVAMSPIDAADPAGDDAALPGLPGTTADPRDLLDRTVPFAVTGRVLVANENLLVPTDRGLLLFDRETGSEVDSMPLAIGGEAAVGTVSAVDRQVVLATPGGVSSFMSIELAEQMLRERIEALPTEPEPRLALVRLAIRVRRLPLVLEAADVALEAIDAMSDRDEAETARAMLFSSVIGADIDSIVSSMEDGTAWFQMVGRVSRSASDDVERLIAQGDWLLERDPQAAVAAWHEILADPERSFERRRPDDRVRFAAAWATERIADAVRLHGRSALADVDAAAAGAFAAVAAEQGADLESITVALDEVSRRWPLSPAAIDAARLAAERRAGAGDVRGAVDGLLIAYRAMPDETRASDLLGAALDHLTRGERPDDAAGLARVVAARHPETMFRRAGVDADAPRSLALAWAGDVAHGAGPEALAPAVADTVPTTLGATPVAVLGGRIPPHRWDGPARWPERGFPAAVPLIRIADEVRLLDSETLEPLWGSRVEGDIVRVLDATDDDILLWTGDSAATPERGGMAEAPAVVSLDAATGEIRWITPLIDEMLPPSIGGDRTGRPMPNRSRFVSREVIVRVHGDRILLARRTGGIVCLDRAAGDIETWAVTDMLEELHELEMDDMNVVATGRARRNGLPQPAGIVIDAETGEVRHRFRPAMAGGIAWVALDGVGGAVFGNDGGLEGFDLVRGTRTWTNTGYAMRGTADARRRGDRIVVRHEVFGLHALNPMTAEIGPPFTMMLGGQSIDRTGAAAIGPHGPDLLLRSQDRVVRFSRDGKILGADAIADPRRDYVRHAVAADGTVFVLSEHDVRIAPAAGGGARQPEYRIYTLDASGRVSDDVVETERFNRPVLAMEWMPGWLLLSTSREVVGIPLIDQ